MCLYAVYDGRTMGRFLLTVSLSGKHPIPKFMLVCHHNLLCPYFLKLDYRTNCNSNWKEASLIRQRHTPFYLETPETLAADGRRNSSRHARSDFGRSCVAGNMTTGNSHECLRAISGTYPVLCAKEKF